MKVRKLMPDSRYLCCEKLRRVKKRLKGKPMVTTIFKILVLLFS
jgi:hypothetical protein